MPKYKPPCDSNFFIRMLHLHAFKHIITSFRKPVNQSDFFDLDKQYQPDSNQQLYQKLQKQQTTHNLKRIFLRGFKFEILLAGLFSVITAVLSVGGALLVKKILVFIQNKKSSPEETEQAYHYLYFWIGLYILKILFDEYSERLFFYLGIKIEQMLMTKILDKIIHMPPHHKSQIPKTQFLNFLMIDVKLVVYAFKYLKILFTAPTTLFFAVYLIFKQGKFYGYILIEVLIVTILIQIIIDQRMSKCRIKKLHIQQERIHTNHELIGQIKQIKMLGWHELLPKKTAEFREKENNLNNRYFFYAHLYDLVLSMLPLIVIAIIFTFQLNYSRSEKTLMGVAELYIMVYFISMTYYPMKYMRSLIVAIYDLNQAVHKIQTFLSEQQIHHHQLKDLSIPLGTVIIENLQCSQRPISQSAHKINSFVSIQQHAGVLKKSTILQNSNHEHKKKKHNASSLSIDIKITVEKGDKVIVLSEEGEGSLFLSTLANEVNINSGKVQFNGKVGYLSSKPWFKKDSILNNIVFGLNQNDLLLRQCYNFSAMKDEIQNFINKDKTIMNETNCFTQCQKKRIAYARVLYSQPDFLVLDDLFNGIDHHSIQKMYQNMCTYLKDKTIFISANQTFFIKPEDKVLIFSKGKAVQFGTFEQLSKKSNSLIQQYSNEKHRQGLTQQQLQQFNEIQAKQRLQFKLKKERNRRKLRVFLRTLKRLVNEHGRERLYQIIEEKAQQKMKLSQIRNSLKKIQVPEQHQQHHILHPQIHPNERVNPVSFNSYYRFFSSSQSKGYVILMIVLIFVTQASKVFLNWWIGHIKHKQHGKYSQSREQQNILIYIEITLLYGALYAIEGYLGVLLSRQSSDKLSTDMINSLAKADMQYFDTHEQVVVTAKTNKDFEQIYHLHHYVHNIFRNVLVFVFTLFLVVIKTPGFIIFAAIILLVNGTILYYFLRTQRQIMRYYSQTTDDLYASFQTVIDGIDTIKQFGNPEEFIAHQRNYLYNYSVIKINQKFIYHAMNILCQISTIFLIAWPAYYAIANKTNMKSANIALVGTAIAYSLKLTGVLATIIKEIVAVEYGMRINVQKTFDVTDLKQQKNLDLPTKPSNWPESGNIKFDRISLKTQKSEIKTVKEISFEIKQGEKVVLIGKNQSGIHEILPAIARYSEPYVNKDGKVGNILIGDYNIKKIGRKYLTQQIYYLTQTPLFFSGTLRQNIDPFHEFRDRDIERVIKLAKIQKKIYQKTDEKILETQLDMSDTKLSVKNTINILRALLRRPTIIVAQALEPNLMEISPQFLISQELKESTILFLTQNMEYSLEASRIMSMDNGKLIQFGNPKQLIDSQGLYAKTMQVKEPSLFTQLQTKKNKLSRLDSMLSK